MAPIFQWLPKKHSGVPSYAELSVGINSIIANQIWFPSENLSKCPENLQYLRAA